MPRRSRPCAPSPCTSHPDSAHRTDHETHRSKPQSGEVCPNARLSARVIPKITKLAPALGTKRTPRLPTVSSSRPEELQRGHFRVNLAPRDRLGELCGLAHESGRFRPWRRALWATAAAWKSWATPFPVGPGDLGRQEHNGAGPYRICRVGAGQVRVGHRGARQVRMAEAGSIIGCDRKAPVRSAWRRSHARTQHTVSAAHPSRHGAPSTKSDPSLIQV